MTDVPNTGYSGWALVEMEEVSILLGHSLIAVTEKHYAFLEGEKVAESLGGKVVKLERVSR